MERVKITVPWPEGLHLRHAVRLVQTARSFHSTVRLKCDGRIADLRSILSIIALCASMGTVLDVEISGDDEADARQTVERVFQP